MLTICKWYVNNHGNYEVNKVFSRTLCKIALVDAEWSPPAGGRRPHGAEFWLVDIIREASPGKTKGCFLVHPIRCVASELADGTLDNPIYHLLPGMFDTEVIYPAGPLNPGVVVVTPRYQDREWIMGMDAARLLVKSRGAYALVVNLGGEPWDHCYAREGRQKVAAGGRALTVTR